MLTRSVAQKLRYCVLRRGSLVCAGNSARASDKAACAQCRNASQVRSLRCVNSFHQSGWTVLRLPQGNRDAELVCRAGVAKLNRYGFVHNG